MERERKSKEKVGMAGDREEGKGMREQGKGE